MVDKEQEIKGASKQEEALDKAIMDYYKSFGKDDAQTRSQAFQGIMNRAGEVTKIGVRADIEPKLDLVDMIPAIEEKE